ncbi:MAG: hemolysin family protein [Mycobacterium sp.]
MVTALGIALGMLVVLAITALTGYFVAQEFAYMAVDRSRLKASAEAGDSAANRALSITRRTSFMLSGAQLGITLTGLVVGYVAEPLIGRGLGELLGGVGIPTAVGIAVGAVLAVLFSTVVQMVFGELLPKNLAIARPDQLARWLSRSTTIYLTLFGWLIKLFDASSNLLLRALRIEPVHDVEHSATPRDLEHIVAESRDAGDLPRELSTLLDRILDFPTRTAEHAMIPRARVDVVAADEPVASVLVKMAHGHTRYPVTGASPDDLLGVVHLHDLLDAVTDSTAGSLCRQAVIVPTTLPLPSILAQLTEAKQEMALVIDEYGGFAGVLTIEDMAEELVGEIADEHDPDVVDDHISAIGDGWLIRGDVHLDEVARTLGHQLPQGDYETLAGLVIAEFGGLPRVGDGVEIALDPDPADLALAATPPTRTVLAEVRAVDHHVPASVFVAVRSGVTMDKGVADDG